MSSSRSSLEFSAEARRQFDFLVKSRGYKIASCSDTKIRYESDGVFLDVFHGERDFEVGINFGRLSKNEDYSFLMFCRLMKIKTVTEIEMISDDKAKIRGLLMILADALKEHGDDIVSGEDNIFEKMSSVRWWHFDSAALGK